MDIVSGSSNTFIGSEAGRGGTTSASYSSGQYNTAIGYQAHGFTTGGNNVVIGYWASSTLTTATMTITMGYFKTNSITTWWF